MMSTSYNRQYSMKKFQYERNPNKIASNYGSYPIQRLNAFTDKRPQYTIFVLRSFLTLSDCQRYCQKYILDNTWILSPWHCLNIVFVSVKFDVCVNFHSDIPIQYRNRPNRQLRARRALLQIKDVPLRTRRALLPLTSTAIGLVQQ